jgi:hypothetical protein
MNARLAAPLLAALLVALASSTHGEVTPTVAAPDNASLGLDHCLVAVGNCTGGHCTANLAGTCHDWCYINAGGDCGEFCTFNIAGSCGAECYANVASACTDPCDFNIVGKCIIVFGSVIVGSDAKPVLSATARFFDGDGSCGLGDLGPVCVKGSGYYTCNVNIGNSDYICWK